MSRIFRFLIHLYPGAWRDRYESEFTALVEDIGPNWGDLLNVLRGAVEMQLGTWNFAKIVTALGVLGGLTGVVVSLAMPAKYRSTAVLRVPATTLPANNAGLIHLVQGSLQMVASRNSLAGIIEKHHLYEDERTSSPLEDAIERMRGDIRVVLLESGGGAFDISFDYSDPLQAQRTVHDLVARLVHGTTQSTTVSPAFDIIDSPSLPQRPISPNPIAVAGWGLGTGLLLGILTAAGVALVRRQTPPGIAR